MGSTGALIQLSGLSGCISNTGTGGACVQGNGLDGAGWVEISPDDNYVYDDGATVYVGARDAGAEVIFSRNTTTGALTQLSGLAGCVSQDGSGGLCAQGPGLVGAHGVTISNDDKNAYVASEGDING